MKNTEILLFLIIGPFIFFFFVCPIFVLDHFFSNRKVMEKNKKRLTTSG